MSFNGTGGNTGADNLPICDTRINRRRGLLASGTILSCQRGSGRSALRRQRARRGGGSGGGGSGSGSRMLRRGRGGNLATRGRSVHTAASHSNALCVCSADKRFFFSAMAPTHQCKSNTLRTRMHTRISAPRVNSIDAFLERHLLKKYPFACRFAKHSAA
jgi:hypothetical protein